MLTNPEIIAALFAGAATILGAFFGFSRWMITKFLSELRPNSGSSMKDWDYETKRPKVKKKEPIKVEVDLLPEVQPSTEQ